MLFQLNQKHALYILTHTRSCNWHFICGFYTNWPLARTTFKRNSAREALWELCTRKQSSGKKLQLRIKTAINHSCWASFKYKSISIFHLEPSPRVSWGTKRAGEWRERYHHTHNIDRLTWENLSFFYDTTRRWCKVKKHSLMLHQKCAYQMKVNFFRAVIGEIDDDDNNERTKNTNSRLQIALQCELSLYHFTPESRERCWNCLARCLLNRFIE